MRKYQVGYTYNNKLQIMEVELDVITEDNIIRKLLKIDTKLAITFDREKLVIDSVVTA